MDPEFLKDRILVADIEAAKATKPSPKTVAHLKRALFEASQKVGWAKDHAAGALLDSERQYFEERSASATGIIEGLAGPLGDHIWRTRASENARGNAKTKREPRGYMRILIRYGKQVAVNMTKAGIPRGKFEATLKASLLEEYDNARAGTRQTLYPFKNADGSPRRCPRSTLSNYFSKYAASAFAKD
ncbi:MAG TPA: hypothetical protein VIH60_04765 [Steroidobacteraceae bacterium]